MVPSGEKQQLVLPLLKTKSGFLKPSYFLTSVQTLWKIDCTNIVPLLKGVSCVHCSAAKCIQDSDTIYWCLTSTRHSDMSHCILSPTCTTFVAVQADHRWPLSSCVLVHCCCQFYSELGSMHWFSHWHSHAPEERARKKCHEDHAPEDESQTKCYTISCFFVTSDLDLWPWHSNSGEISVQCT